MERIAANDGKVKAVSDCKWTEGKSHRWRRFVQFEGDDLETRRYAQEKRYSIRGNDIRKIWNTICSTRSIRDYFVTSIFYISSLCGNNMEMECSRWKSVVLGERKGQWKEGRDCRRFNLLPRCVGGNWRNREGNEIWNSVTLLPRFERSFQVYLFLRCLFRVS